MAKYRQAPAHFWVALAALLGVLVGSYMTATWGVTAGHPNPQKCLICHIQQGVIE
ncbi:MAG: hypothetical protein GWN58_00740 [Anaerolineae bacterium]|nr:hypothetical protein [Anaerolineae bacterium]